MRKTALLCRASLIASALVGFTAAPVHAQDAEAAASNDDDAIVVVARKREERVLDVPIAVTAISETQLAKMGANDLSGVQGAMPNVNIVQGRGSASSANMFIRGIGQPDALQTFDPAVGVYVDGVYMSRIQGALLNLFDVQRVEVLRGPQGTLYGKNTIGGAVNVVSRKPDLNQLNGEAAFTYGRFDEMTAKGYVSAPLVPGAVALSLAGVYDDRDGIVTDAITGKKYNDRNNTALRGILRAQPRDGLEVLISGDYTRQRNTLTLGHATASLVGYNYIAAAPFIEAFTILPAEPYGAYDYKAATSFANGEGQKLDHWGTSGTINLDLAPGLQLTSITAYRELKSKNYVDIDATAAELGDVLVDVDQHQFSQELQLKLDTEKLKGVFGLYYLNEHIVSHQEAYADSYLRSRGLPLSFLRTIDDEQDTKSYAAFGQLTYNLTQQLSLTAGLRYTSETKQYYRTTTTYTGGVASAPFVFPNSLPAPANAQNEVTYNAWTPSFTLGYKPNANSLVYASASRGFKSGGFNGRSNSINDLTLEIDGKSQVVTNFKPESVWTYELGYKASFADGKVNLAADVFRSDYQDFQARVGGGNTGVTGGSFPVINAGKLRIQGVEVEGMVKPWTGMTLTASLGYLDAEYKEFNDGRRAPAFSCNPTGKAIVCKPAFAPPVTFRTGMDQKFGLGDATLSLGGDIRFVDKHYLSIDNRAGLMEDGYWLGNVYAQVDYGQFYLRGMVKNVGNTLYKTDGQEFSSVGNIQTVYFGDPRTWQVTVGVKF